ncbi:MAG TPA: sialidase family protein [Candidatus Acidoferrales bacterium]|nr:sialidase family protein [Candidatus Acidoferrales bacterium]
MKSPSGKRFALHVATLSGWHRFEQQDGEWRQTGRALTYWSLTCVTVDPEQPRIVYAGTEHSGLFISHDGGAHWARANPNVPRLMVFSLLAQPGRVLVGTVPAAMYRSEPGGGWREIEGVRLASQNATFPPSPELQSRTRFITADPNDPARLYVGIEVGGMLLSADGGKSWTAADSTLTDLDVHEILACEKSPGTVLAACGDKVFRSFDAGGRWEEITPSSHPYGMALAEDRNGVVYLASARGRPNTWLGEERAGAAIFRSRDFGARWEPAVQNLKGGVMSMCRKPDGPGVLAGTSEGEILGVDESGARVLASGLPCITSLAPAV